MTIPPLAHPITPASLPAILALNNAHARELSWLEMPKLEHLVGQAFLAIRAGEADAFLIAFDQDADYDSANFLWFRARYPRFAYVDRVAVSEQARGKGIARLFYQTLFDKARGAGHTVIACEGVSRSRLGRDLWRRADGPVLRQAALSVSSGTALPSSSPGS
jgi:predicted GNAT superfamily acetyltransferase